MDASTSMAMEHVTMMVVLSLYTAKKMGRYCSMTMCHYWDMSVK